MKVYRAFRKKIQHHFIDKIVTYLSNLYKHNAPIINSILTGLILLDFCYRLIYPRATNYMSIPKITYVNLHRIVKNCTKYLFLDGPQYKVFISRWVAVQSIS